MTTATVRKNNNRIKRDRVFPIVNTIILVLLMFITLYPVINTVAYSFNDGTDALRGGIGLWPRVFSTKSYTSILSDGDVYQAAFISAAKSWEGTATALTECLAAADPALLLAPNAVTRILNAAGGLTEKQYGFSCRPRRDGNTKLLQLSAAKGPVS